MVLRCTQTTYFNQHRYVFDMKQGAEVHLIAVMA